MSTALPTEIGCRDRPPYQSVFHDHDIVADPDFAVFRGQDRAMQYAGPLAQSDRATQHS
jgi:hypothetical protein